MVSNDDKYNIFTECIIEDDEDKKEDFDIIDEEILNEMKKEKQMKIEKENKKRLEEQISELKKELDNL